jgi:pimeloyl-ACP methyl ester carboxylesterase
MKFDCDSHRIGGFDLSYLDSGEDKPLLHFYHANGFPVSVYLPLLNILTEDFRVVGLGQRGQDAQTEGNLSWHSAAADLIDFLEKKQLHPILGVGHSLGAVATLFASAQRPSLFSKIILIDPVLLPSSRILALAFMKLLGRKDLFFLAKRARQRANGWEDRHEAYDYFRTKSLFRTFQDTFLRSYVTYGLKPSDSGGVELLCPPEAEARIFENYPLDVWSWPKKIHVPALIIRGEYSDVLSEREVKRFCRKCGKASSRIMKQSGHLAPMENPTRIVDLIKEF